MALDQQHVLIVGGSSGIGFGVAEEMLRQGARVTIVGRSEAKLRAAKERLSTDRVSTVAADVTDRVSTVAADVTDRVSTVAADVTDEAQVRSLFEQSGAIDHLVITRGVVPLSAMIDALDLDAARRFIDLMIVSALSLVKHATPTLRRGGSITFTSGISKDKVGPGGSVVAAVAGAMGYVARSLAVELAPTRVNVVSPGWVETEMWDEIAGPHKQQMWSDMGAKLPAGRVAKPADIAKAYTFLLGSELTTGIVVDIDGGHRLI